MTTEQEENKNLKSWNQILFLVNCFLLAFVFFLITHHDRSIRKNNSLIDRNRYIIDSVRHANSWRHFDSLQHELDLRIEYTEN